MSLDKLIAAATEYFTTGADVHRRALAGGGGKITDFSEPATKKIASKTTKTTAVEQTGDDLLAKAKVAEDTAAAEAKAIEEATVKAQTRDDSAKVGPEDDGVGDLDAISYEEDIRPLIRTKSLANRDALVALLGKFNVKSGQELTADQYPAFLAGLKAI